MTITMGGITVDCANPHTLADFWTKALGYEIAHDYGTFVFIGPADKSSDNTVYLGFQQVPEERVGKNRLHIDFRVDDRAAESARLVELGATVVGEHAVPTLSWTVLRDPEGNEFCVGQPDEA
ncbi:VOC family protein [Actinokineospora inagensis]|uniref:VOC family protein n=1 Tax=Actinokineospora inagensis TaxID=103730 RepID=UPI00047C72B8|nr:VOC family protein [Actinokineospora inagensis]